MGAGNFMTGWCKKEEKDNYDANHKAS